MSSSWEFSQPSHPSLFIWGYVNAEKVLYCICNFSKISANLERHNRVYILSFKHSYRPMRARSISAQVFSKSQSKTAQEWRIARADSSTTRTNITFCWSLSVLLLSVTGIVRRTRIGRTCRWRRTSGPCYTTVLYFLTHLIFIPV